MTEELSRDARLAEQLVRLLQAVEAAGYSVLGAPGSNRELLQSIVDAAARIFGAAAASIALVDEAQQVLEFKVAYGIGNENVVGMRLPIDQGIAGYVAMTGQPMAISNVGQDARFNQDFARTTGYVPSSILATPLLLGDRVIGVMEVLDKINAPAFGMQDMELLGLFARQSAIAIHQAQQYDQIGQALIRGLQRLAAGESPHSADELLRALEAAGAEAGTRDLFALADLYYQISGLGDAERQACLKILAAFADYGRSRPGYF